MNQLKTSLILNRAGSHSGVKQGAASTPNHTDTHVGSLGSLGTWMSFVTWVALKCKGRSPG